VATLDDAAEALVIKLRGLDSEIEESEHRLGDFRGRIEGAVHEVDQEWTALTEAMSTFLAKVHEEQDRLGQETQHALQAVSDAQQAITTGSAEAQSEIAEGRAHLDALAQHATSMQASVESLASEAGETPAHSLAQHAAQIEQDMVHALDEARDFVRNDVVHGMEEVAHDIRDRCHALRTALAEEGTHALQAAFDEWESKVHELQDYVHKEGFLASRDHAKAWVDYALSTCQAAYEEQLDGLRQAMDVLGAHLKELATEAQRSGDGVVAQTGGDLTGRLSDTHEAVATALSALGSVRDLLISYSFVRM
jgi:chromosome segregation ATPase